MRFVFRSSLIILILSSFFLFIFGCSAEKEAAKGEALKLAAKAFQPTMKNLQKVLKDGDLAAAKDTLSVLTKKFAAIKAAEIPVRLAENSERVQSQVDALSTSMDELSSALTQPDLAEIDSTILEKFDSTYKNFARLGGLLRVKIPELVSFHKALYRLWHDYYPNDQIDSIKAIVPQFKEKAEALNAIKWPDVLAGDADKLNQKVKDLQQSVDNLEAACQGDDAEAILKASEVLHVRYVAVNRML